MFDLIAFDADDTLWHSEDLYLAAQQQFAELLAHYCDQKSALQALHDTEIRNLAPYGYGAKAFMLSMIETALALSKGQVTADEIAKLLALGRKMLSAEVRLLDHAKDVLIELSATHSLMVITKGDLAHQESKLADSGLARYFRHVEIVADKTRAIYAAILDRYHISPANFLMVGNSPRSDIMPVLELGGWAVLVPYQILWSHEHIELPAALAGRYFEIEHLGRLPDLIATIEQEDGA